MRTDIWSLGVVVYRMLAGRAPFGGETKVELLCAIAFHSPVELAHAVPHVPPELSRIVMKALCKEPRDRFASVGELAGALAPFGPPESFSGVMGEAPIASWSPRVYEPHSAERELGSTTLDSSGDSPRERRPSRLQTGIAIAIGIGLAVVVGIVLGVRWSASSGLSAPAAAAEPPVPAPAAVATLSPAASTALIAPDAGATAVGSAAPSAAPSAPPSPPELRTRPKPSPRRPNRRLEERH